MLSKLWVSIEQLSNLKQFLSLLLMLVKKFKKIWICWMIKIKVDKK